MNFGFDWSLIASAQASAGVEAYTIFREWTPYAIYEVPAGVNVLVEQVANLYLGPVGLSFNLDFTVADFGVNMWYSTNRNMPGHQCYSLEWSGAVADVGLGWSTSFRESTWSLEAETTTHAYSTYSLPVPLWGMELLEDLHWGDSIIEWTCNDFDFLNINSDAAHADEGTQPVPEHPDEWVVPHFGADE